MNCNDALLGLSGLKRWEVVQTLRAHNDIKPLSEIRVGEIVRVQPDHPFCTAGNEEVVEVTNDEIVTGDEHSKSRWSKTTGHSLTVPWAYFLPQPTTLARTDET